MSNRTIRINELIQRELGDYLHTKHQDEAVTITISGVEVAPDLKTGRIYVAVLGDDEHVAGRMKWLRSRAGEFRRELARRVILKHTPEWTYVSDKAHVRSSRVLSLLDELARKEQDSPPESPAT